MDATESTMTATTPFAIDTAPLAKGRRLFRGMGAIHVEIKQVVDQIGRRCEQGKLSKANHDMAERLELQHPMSSSDRHEQQQILEPLVRPRSHGKTTQRRARQR